MITSVACAFFTIAYKKEKIHIKKEKQELMAHDPAAVKKSLSAQFSVEVPPPLEHTDPEALSALLKSSPESVTVVDVRLPEEYATGHIAGSVNVPHSDFNAEELVSKVLDLKNKNPNHKIIFTSLQSPDVDEAIAQDFIRAWEDASSTAGTSPDTTSAFVSLLLGGVFYWLRLYGHSTELTSSFSTQHWDDVLAKHALTSD